VVRVAVSAISNTTTVCSVCFRGSRVGKRGSEFCSSRSSRRCTTTGSRHPRSSISSSGATFTVELFLRGTDAVRSRVLTADGDLRDAELTDGNVYHSPTVFQLKTILYHAGFLDSRGSEPSRLDPTADEWTLRQPLKANRCGCDVLACFVQLRLRCRTHHGLRVSIA
jgi:hypothetical protein